MSECTHCTQIMGSSKAPHEHLVKLREHHTHPVYRCSKCGSELVLLFDCWEPCFQGWLPAATG
ncbi:hypothetical protein SAMN05421647_102153 [Marinobacterium stanieri]|uniref:Uncharacterized protein n=1 Tax=Marinobacterium stanieri TaxID=49186 RepID=A0A1N6Q001_9GAMM|nr:hypothetical protein SAMN05421647_102153 [Marinobacterium stanieri]